MADALQRAGHVPRGLRVAKCHATGTVAIYDDGETRWMPDEQCVQSKVCPFCARRASSRRVAKYMPHLKAAALRERIYFGTLTIANVPTGSLDEGVRALWAAWTHFRRRQVWDMVVAASMVNMETTFSSDGFNLHLHVLAASPWRADFNYARMREVWQDCAPEKYPSRWIRFDRVRPSSGSLGAALREIVKYTSKFKARKGDSTEGGGLLDAAPEQLAEYVDVFTGMRSMRTYGKWYAVKDEHLPEDLRPEPFEIDDEPARPVAWIRWTWEGGALRVYLKHDLNSTTLTPAQLAALLEKVRKKARGPT